MGTNRLNPILGTCGPYQNPVIINPYSFAAAGGGTEFAFLQGSQTNTDGTSFTFSSQNFGTADANRKIIAAVFLRSPSLYDLTGITIGGASATIDKYTRYDSAGVWYVAIASASVPTGTSGDVVVNMSNSTSSCAIALYRAVGTLAVSDTDSVTGTTLSVTLTVPTNGVVIGISGKTAVSTASWSGLTEDWEGSQDSARTGSAASASVPAGDAALAVTVTWSPTSASSVAICVAYTLT